MEREPLVSIIAPVYNVEAYLPKMIDSVLAQTFSNFEFLLVDDGTPDSSGKICDEAAVKDSRIKVIHKKNGGSASARNVGMERALGKYLFFVDSDDWIEPDMLRSLVDAAEKYQCMLVVTGFCMEYYETGKFTSYDVDLKPAEYLTQNEFRANAYKYFNQSFWAFPWNKLYLTEHIKTHGIVWPEQYIQWNDFPFNMDYIRDITSAVFVPGTMYHYFRSRPGAEGATVSEKAVLYDVRKDQFSYILRLYQYWNIADKKSIETIHGYYVSRLLQCIQESAAVSGTSNQKKREQIREILHDEQAKKSLKLAKVEGTLMHIAILPMKWGSVSFCLLEGKFIGYVKNNMANFFYRLRAKVVNKGTVRTNTHSGGGYRNSLIPCLQTLDMPLPSYAGGAAA